MNTAAVAVGAAAVAAAVAATVAVTTAAAEFGKPKIILTFSF